MLCYVRFTKHLPAEQREQLLFYSPQYPFVYRMLHTFSSDLLHCWQILSPFFHIPKYHTQYLA